MKMHTGTMMNRWLSAYPREGRVSLSEIPRLAYSELYEDLCQCLREEHFHVASYFGVPGPEGLLLICLVMDDLTGCVRIASYLYGTGGERILPSVTAVHPAMHVFEREIAENFGVPFADQPWNKPLRYAHDRADRLRMMNDYPFYAIDGEALHEVNVGPIHAGIIEPGCFRFICNGEQIVHLEIMLGYQHRGVERLMRETENRLRQAVLSESIAGDSAVAHGTTYAMLAEALSGHSVPESLEIERTLALELERIAIHIADTGALCTDIGYQLGQVACEALRTIVINTTQAWCGNRFGKGLIRPGGTYYPLTESLGELVQKNLEEVKRRFAEVTDDIMDSASVLSRFEDCGVLTRSQAWRIGAVGEAARASGLKRDLRATHPTGAFRSMMHEPVMAAEGDVFSRLKIRLGEVMQSIDYVTTFVDRLKTGKETSPRPDYTLTWASSSLAFACQEGWRGEIVHVALTDEQGRLTAYKIKDPSLHNWMGLALAVRREGISDFPICNKSFNLSYCGHDL